MNIRQVSAVAACSILALGLSGCGGDDDASPTTPTDNGAAATTIAGEASTESLVTTAGTAVAADEDVTEAAGCDAEVQAGIDANEFLRSTKVEFTDQVAAPEHTFALADGVLTPSEITVPVGSPVSFVQATGGIDGIIIGCADGVTSMDGATSSFIISAPGVYTVRLDIAGTDIGTITVE